MKYLKPISTAVLIVLLGVGVMTLAIALSACSTPQPTTVHKPHPYSGDHTLGQLRGMFSVCYQTRRGVAPYFPPPMHMKHCDCLVDKSREKYSSQDYDTLDKGVLADFFRDASIDCDIKLGLPSINETEPAKPDPASI